MSGTSLLLQFSAREGPRQTCKVVYPLPEILLLVLCATLSGMDDFVETKLWGEQRLDFLRRLLPFERGIPSHDTLNDVMSARPAPLFAECSTKWVEALREREPDIVAIDGKSPGRARHGDKAPLHLVSAWAARQRLVLGQEQRDHRRPAPVGAPRTQRRPGHHRRGRLPACHRRGDPRQGR